MLNVLNTSAPVTVNGVQYESSQKAYEHLKDHQGTIDIRIVPGDKYIPAVELHSMEPQFTVTVKPWMTEKSSPGFEFMEEWNNNNPVPLETMRATVLVDEEKRVKMDMVGPGGIRWEGWIPRTGIKSIALMK